MMTLIRKQLVHRIKTSKFIILCYVMMIFLGMMTFQMPDSIDVKSSYWQISSTEYYLSQNGTLLPYLLLVIGILSLCMLRMYSDYRQGAIRWALLTRKKQAFVLGDIMFLFLSIVILTLIYAGVHCWNVQQLLDILGRKNVGNMQITEALEHMDGIRILMKADIMTQIVNLTFLLCICSMIVCGIRYLLSEWKHKFIYVVLTAAGILVLLCGGICGNTILQITMYIALTIFYIIEACRGWQI